MFSEGKKQRGWNKLAGSPQSDRKIHSPNQGKHHQVRDRNPPRLNRKPKGGDRSKTAGNDTRGSYMGKSKSRSASVERIRDRGGIDDARTTILSNAFA